MVLITKTILGDIASFFINETIGNVKIKRENFSGAGFEMFFGKDCKIAIFCYHQNMAKTTYPKSLFTRIYKDPQYRGKHVIVIANKVFATKTGKEKSELLDKLLKKYPRATPTITYIPKADNLILIFV